MTENIIRVACLGFVFDPLAQQLVRQIAPPEFDLRFAEKPDATTPALVAESDFVICVSHVTDSMMANAPKLRLIQKWGIGVDKIDLAAAERHGIYVAITAGVNATVVGEHAIMLILAGLRRLPVANRQMRDGGWSAATLRPYTRQLRGKTVGILGLGNIGRAVAKQLQGFDVRILYNDIKGEFAIAKDLHAEFVSYQELLEQSDVLTVHIPGSKANRCFVDAAALVMVATGNPALSLLAGAAAGCVVGIIVGGKQAECIHRQAHSRGRIDARRDHEGYIIFGQMLFCYLQFIKQTNESLARAFTQDLQAIVRKYAILTDQGHHVR